MLRYYINITIHANTDVYILLFNLAKFEKSQNYESTSENQTKWSNNLDNHYST